MSEPYYTDGDVTLYLGDCLAVLPSLPDNSIDSICTDPPYGLEFMGKDWDGSNGFRRSLNEADTGRDNVFGRTSRTSPEYITGKRPVINKPDPNYRYRENQGIPVYGASGNPTCRNCGGDKYRNGDRKCACEHPEFPNQMASQMNIFQQWCEAWARECLRVLKPGGWMLCFGGTRTWHRLTCGIEDAGFEIRGSTLDLTGQEAPGLAWIYGQGMPKNLDAGRAVDMHVCALPGRHFMRRVPDEPKPDDHVCPESERGDPWRGWGTSDKPAWEPIVVARKPLAGTLGRNLVEHGVGALNINGCRVETTQNLNGGAHASNGGERYDGAENWRFKIGGAGEYEQPDGRWPPNVLLGEQAAAELDRQSGVISSGANPTRRSSDKFRDAYGEFAGQAECVAHRGADSGGASRFFPVFRYEAKADASERPRLPDGTAHPTVKPRDLARWMIRFVTPPGGTVLDLFAGSGTFGEAAIIEGFPCILIEQDPASAELIVTRLRKPIQPVLFGEAS